MKKDERQRIMFKNDNFWFFCISVRAWDTLHYLSLYFILSPKRNFARSFEILCRAICNGMLSSLLNSIGQFGQDALGVVPTDTCVGDGDSVFKTGLALLGHLLVAFADVRFDHDAHD
jgi:hypothetical protein